MGQPVSARVATRYDLALFERLNDEYEQRRIVRAGPATDQAGRAKRARRRLRKFTRWSDLSGKRVLEVGCGQGHLTRALVRQAGAREAVGVDIAESPTWERFASRRVRFHRADLATDELFPAGSVDAVVSSAVLEHVRYPLAMIEAIARVLRTGGEAVLYFNLYRGPRASHRYREVFFPWPHLLFEPMVCEEFYERRHGTSKTFAWVNRLTAAEYLDAFCESGLQVERVRRHSIPFDAAFYREFEERLGTYPALDLETDFLTVKLRKPRRRSRVKRESLEYLARQRELEAALEPLRDA